MGGSNLDNETKTKPTIEEAIQAWENDPKKNADGYKIVRGTDGLPVEILYKSSGKYAIKVNATETPFEADQIDLVISNLKLKQWMNGNVFDQYYEKNGLQQFKNVDGLDPNHYAFVFGTPAQPPENFSVTLVA